MKDRYEDENLMRRRNLPRMYSRCAIAMDMYDTLDLDHDIEYAKRLTELAPHPCTCCPTHDKRPCECTLRSSRESLLRMFRTVLGSFIGWTNDSKVIDHAPVYAICDICGKADLLVDVVEGTLFGEPYRFNRCHDCKVNNRNRIFKL